MLAPTPGEQTLHTQCRVKEPPSSPECPTAEGTTLPLTFGEHLQADAGVAPMPVWGVQDIAVVGALVLQLHVFEGEGHIVLGGVPSELHPVPKAFQLLIHDLHPELQELGEEGRQRLAPQALTCPSQASPSPARPAPSVHPRCMLTPLSSIRSTVPAQPQPPQWPGPGSPRDTSPHSRLPVLPHQGSCPGRGLCAQPGAGSLGGGGGPGDSSTCNGRAWTPRNAHDYFKLGPGPLCRPPALARLTSSSEQFLHSWYVQLRENCLFSTL